MPTTYNENGVTYDVAGLMSTMVQMREKERMKRILLLRIDAVIMNDIIWQDELENVEISDDAKWVVTYIMKVVKSAQRDEQKEIYNLISNS
jgi:hypothetical protein